MDKHTITDIPHGSKAGRGGWRDWLSRPGIVIFAAILGVLFTLPALWSGWEGDDHFHRLVFRDPAGAEALRIHNTAEPTGLFTFVDGDPDHTLQLMDVGIAPWWTYTGITSNFLRPVTWATHWLDYKAWPESPALMHAQSVLWYGLVVVAVGCLYRRLMGAAWVAGVAVLMFAFDDAHATTVGWISNRNALVMVFFGLLTLLAHDLWRRDGRRVGAALGPLFLLASVLSAEGGIATAAYLVAYALFVDRGAWRSRFASLVPYGLVVVIWRIVWTRMGYGSSGMGLYTDPWNEPLRFVVAAVERVPVILLGQLAFPPTELTIILSPGWAMVLWAVALLFVVLLAVIFVPLLRKDSMLRFWATGTIFALVPCCATIPSDRNLLFLSVGAFGLAARYLVVIGDQPVWLPGAVTWRRLSKAFCWLFVLGHLGYAPLALLVRAAAPLGPKAITDQLLIGLPLDPEIAQQDVVVVGAPSAFHAGYLPILRASYGEPVPAHTRVLTPTLSAVTLTRLDAWTLMVRPDTGFLKEACDQLFRGAQQPMSLGDRVELTGMTAEVTAMTDDGRPAEAKFRFAVPLEDPSLRWLRWQDGRFVGFTPPAVGQTVELPVPDVGLWTRPG